MRPYHLIRLGLLTFQENVTSLNIALQMLVQPLSQDMKKDLQYIITATENFGRIFQTAPQDEEDLANLTVDALSVLRHDLRSPINIIMNYSDIILEDLDPTLDDFDKICNLLGQYNVYSRDVLDVIEKIRNDHYTIEQEEKILLQEESADYDEQAAIPSTILIVDDNLQNHDILTRRLGYAGHTILTATNGYDGLEKIKTNNVDLILLDLVMPGMSGYEFLKTIKSDQHLQHIPVLMISSTSEITSIVECIEAGAEDYLSIPFNPVFLRARINACLEKKKMRDRELLHNEQLLSVQQQLEVAIHSLYDGFVLFNTQDEIVLYNQPFQELYPVVGDIHRHTSLTFKKFLQENLKTNTYPDIATEDAELWIEKSIQRHLQPRGSYVQLLSNHRWVEVQEFKTPDGGIVAIHKDITRQRKTEEELRFMALHDGLTGLANRVSFEKSLQDHINLYQREGHPFAVLFFDLDGFKLVNDTLGHEFGDVLLKKVAMRLQDSVRTSDVVARVGGDEFCILLIPLSEKKLSETVAKRALEKVGTQVEHNGKTAHFGISIGIAFFPEDGKTAEDIIKHADEAMYKAKTSGKGRFAFYSAA